LTVTGAAEALGVCRRTLSAIVNGRSEISPEMAVRLSVAFDTTAESWLAQQLQYDLWQAEKKRASLRVTRLSRLPSSEPASMSRPGTQELVARRRFSDSGIPRGFPRLRRRR